jgi:hypothetical protein
VSEHHHYDHRDAACEDCMAREARIAELENELGTTESRLRRFDQAMAWQHRIAELEALVRKLGGDPG